MIMIELIDLQTAHVTQGTTDNVKTMWVVKKNITSERLGDLPKGFTEAEVFHVLDFARKYELIAFNSGIQHAKSLANGVLKEEILTLRKEIIELSKNNEYLADVLEKFTNKEV